MFVQIIRAKVADPGGVKAQWDRWISDLAPAGEGWLGSTGGITADGTLVVASRFDTEEAAQRVSASPAQSEWWSDLERSLEGPALSHDCSDVDLLMGGGSDDAGFVQFMQARVTDPARFRELEADAIDTFGRLRPDFMGSIRAWHGDGIVTAVDYFTSEEDARKGEQQQLPADAQAEFDEWFSLLEDVQFWDIPEPWMASPAGS